MFERIKDFIRRVRTLFSKDVLEKKMQVDIITSDKMAKAINEWSRIYEDKAPWLSNTVKSMNLGATIASEFARLTTLEMASKVEGNDYLNKQYQNVIESIRTYTEYACAKGGLVFKPYVSGENIEIDLVQADFFFPTAYNSRGEITGSIFVDTKTIGEYVYTRLEYHNLTQDGYYISNKAFKARNLEGNINLGTEIPLTEIDDWADLEPDITIQNVDKPLFAYFKVPTANTIDTASPLGVSVFSRAVNDIKEADKQYSRLLWEFEGGELAIDASVDCFKVSGENTYELPTGKERLYRMLRYGVDEVNKAFEVFSPTLRDVSLINGLNTLLKQIEYKCGLAYGTISDPQQIEKTAEEIRSSKQRSYQSITDTQKSLQKALEHLVYCMGIIGQISGLPTKGKNQVTFEWDDSILIDAEKERKEDRQDVTMGVMSHAEYRAKWYGETLEQAEKNLPEQADTIM